MTTRGGLVRSSRGLLLTVLIATCLIAAAAIDVPAGAADGPGRDSSAVQAHLARLAAPQLTIAGRRLLWSAVKGVRSYVLARRGPGRASAYRVLARTSVVPNAVPGRTVHYTVKTNIAGSAWAPPVTVVYNRWGGIDKVLAPASRSSRSHSSSANALDAGAPGDGSTVGSPAAESPGSGSGDSWAGGGSGTGSSGSGSGGEVGQGEVGQGEVAPVEVAPGEEQSSPQPHRLKVGLIGGITGWGASASETVREATGVKFTRLDPGGEGWGPSTEMVHDGITPYALYNPGMHGMSPAAVAAGVKSYIPHMHELGETEIELGNEVYYNGSSAEEYAAQYRAAHEALAGSGITLIADAWTDALKPNGEWSQWESGGGWCVLFVEALGYVPDAWSFHPYGPMNADGFGSYGIYRTGWATVPRMISYMKADHLYAPLNITEVGQPTYQGTDGNTAVTEAEQAADVKQYIKQAAEWGLASIYLYEGIDTGEGGYGLYEWPLKAKPSATAFAEAVAKFSSA